MKSILALCLFGTSLSVHAATLTVGYQATVPNATPETSVAFPTGPNTDWGYFQYDYGDPGASANMTSMSAYNSADFSGSRNFVVTSINGGYLRGPGNLVTGAPLSYFDVSNGEWLSPASDVRPAGIFNSQLGSAGATANAGVQMSLNGFTTQSQIQIWTYGFGSTGIFEIFVNGATSAAYSQSVTVTSVNSPVAGKIGQLFTLDFTPDSTASTLDIVYRMTGSTNASSHVGFQAITISPIPEPAALSLLGIAGVLGFIRRRR